MKANKKKFELNAIRSRGRGPNARSSRATATTMKSTSCDARQRDLPFLSHYKGGLPYNWKVHRIGIGLSLHAGDHCRDCLDRWSSTLSAHRANSLRTFRPRLAHIGGITNEFKRLEQTAKAFCQCASCGKPLFLVNDLSRESSALSQ